MRYAFNVLWISILCFIVVYSAIGAHSLQNYADKWKRLSCLIDCVKTLKHTHTHSVRIKFKWTSGIFFAVSHIRYITAKPNILIACVIFWLHLNTYRCWRSSIDEYASYCILSHIVAIDIAIIAIYSCVCVCMGVFRY